MQRRCPYDSTVDVVLCQMGLMFMENRTGAIAEMRRVLAPSGRVVVTTPGRIQPLFEVMERAIVEQISADLGGFVSSVFSMHDPEAVAAQLREGGFRDVSASVSTTTFRLPPPARFLWQYINLTPMAALIGQAPEEAKEAMKRQFVDGAPAACGRRGDGCRAADGDRDRPGLGAERSDLVCDVALGLLPPTAPDRVRYGRSRALPIVT